MVHTYSGELDGDCSDHHDSAYFEIDSDEDDPDSPLSGFGSPADKGGIPSDSTQPSQFDAPDYLDLTKRIDAVGLTTYHCIFFLYRFCSFLYPVSSFPYQRSTFLYTTPKFSLPTLLYSALSAFFTPLEAGAAGAAAAAAVLCL